MKIIDPGHAYELDILDGDRRFPETLIFVKREGENYPGNVGHHPGTNLQEVLRVLIDRVKYLDTQIANRRNQTVLYCLRSSIFELEMRAAERHNRVLPLFNMDRIEEMPTCEFCGHISCEGSCKNG